MEAFINFFLPSPRDADFDDEDLDFASGFDKSGGTKRKREKDDDDEDDLGDDDDDDLDDDDDDDLGGGGEEEDDSEPEGLDGKFSTLSSTWTFGLLIFLKLFIKDCFYTSLSPLPFSLSPLPFSLSPPSLTSLSIPHYLSLS